MPDANDIRIANNAGWWGVLTLTDKDGVARDLTGATFEMDIRATPDAAAELATLTTGNGRIGLNDPATDGKVLIEIPEAVAASLDPGLYYYDLLMTIAGDTERVTFGTIGVVEGVSR